MTNLPIRIRIRMLTIEKGFRNVRQDLVLRNIGTKTKNTMGKNNSKLRKRNRTQSMAWNFRFPSITSLSMRKKNTNVTNQPHMSITQWLNILNLSHYENLFKKFKGIEDVMKYTEQDLKDLGVKNETHCFQMASSLVALKTKYERTTRTNVSNCVNDKTQRHSLAVDPTVLVNQNATESDILIIKNFNQSKSLSNIKMETVSSENDTDAVQLKKILEWELSLDARDLRSHAWYHGAIPRVRAEEIVGDRDGDFLVRDCTSQPGNYVLSCRSKGQKLHFVINKIILQPDTVYETVQYRFEEDGFDTVPDLITYYVGSGKSITSASGAKIQNPRNRTYPLSFYSNKYEMLTQSVNRNDYLDSSNSSLCGGGNSLIASPPRSRRDLSSTSWFRSNCKKQRSLSLLPGDANMLSRVVLDDLKSNAFGNGTCSSFSHSLPRRSFSSKIKTASPSPINTSSSTTTMPRNIKKQFRYGHSSPSFERKEYTNGSAVGQHDTLSTAAPPKPSRYCGKHHPQSTATRDDLQLVCKEFSRKNSIYLPSGGSDSGNGSGDSVHSCSAVDENSTSLGNGSESSNCSTPVSTMQRRSAGVMIKNPKYYGLSSASSVTTLKAYSYDPLVDDVSLSMAAIGADLPSAFDLETFYTLLLPTIENKPLDATALQGIHMLLMESGSRILANHLTRVDLELTVHKLKEGVEYMCKTGIELCLLPHGHQHRLDLIERTQCLKLLVAVTILMCATESERAELLNKWIEVAIDTKTALGNLFGFCAIMLGLCIPQIQRLNETWHILRQKYTDSAFNFEAKLRPVLKSMNESTNPLAPNTTIPHLLPIILLYERTHDETSDDLIDKSSSLSSTIGQWETSTPDLGLSTLYSHLSSNRQYHKSLNTFKRNAEIVLSDSKIDDLLTDMFRTEFHLKFLWGSRGATVTSSERYSKFEQILDVMSEKCENLSEREPSPEMELINYATSV